MPILQDFTAVNNDLHISIIVFKISAMDILRFRSCNVRNLQMYNLNVIKTLEPYVTQSFFGLYGNQWTATKARPRECPEYNNTALRRA